MEVEYDTDATMYSDEEDLEDVEDSDTEDDIEYQLKHLRCYDNLKQLKLLNKEIRHIVLHGIQPEDDWYDERFVMIDIYSTLGWENLAMRFQNRDDYIYNASSYIMMFLRELIEDRSTKARFNLITYRNLLYNVKSVWDYYSREYMKGETDIDILDIIEGVRFM